MPSAIYQLAGQYLLALGLLWFAALVAYTALLARAAKS